MFKETIVFDYDILRQRLREMAFLTKGLKITLRDERVGETKEGEEPEKICKIGTPKGKAEGFAPIQTYSCKGTTIRSL